MKFIVLIDHYSTKMFWYYFDTIDQYIVVKRNELAVMCGRIESIVT